MAAANIYSLIGRAMDGSEVSGYFLRDTKTMGTKFVTKEQMAFLVGGKRVENCTGQLYENSVIFRGVGFDIRSMPIMRGEQVKAGGKVVEPGRARYTAQQTMGQLTATHVVYEGRNVLGYVLSSATGPVFLQRQRVVEIAKKGMVVNLRAQAYNGETILRGVNVNLNQLPKVTYEQLKAQGLAG